MTTPLVLNLPSQTTKSAAALARDAIGLGEGTRLAFKSSFQKEVIETFVANGLPEPVFEETQGGMAVTVFKQAEQQNLKKTVGVANVGANHLLAYIQTHPVIAHAQTLVSPPCKILLFNLFSAR